MHLTIQFVCRLYIELKRFYGVKGQCMCLRSWMHIEVLGLRAGALSQSRRSLLCGLARRHQQHGLSDWEAWFASLTVNIVPGKEIMLFVLCSSRKRCLFFLVIRQLPFEIQKFPQSYFAHISSSNVLEVIFLL